MAVEHEIDRLVVRLVGNQQDYQKMLKDVERQTEESAKFAEKQGNKISEAFNKAFRGAQGMLSGTGGTMQRVGLGAGAAGAAITGPMTKAAMDFSEYGKNIKEMVRETEKAAKEAEFFKKRLVENTEAWRELNKVVKLNVEQAQVFKLMSERTGISVKELTENIKVGSEEYVKWRKEAEKFGMMFSDEDIKKADELAESWQRVKQSLQGMWMQIGSVITEELKELNDLIVGVVKWTVNWVKENKQLIATVADVAAKLVIVGGVLTTIGTALTTLSATLGPVVVMIAAGAAAWAAWDTATGKMLRGEATSIWKEYEDSIISAYNTTMEYGKYILDHINKVMDGVFNAVKAGNLELAVKIAWSGAKVAWIEGMNEIDKLTGERFSAIFKNLAAGNFKNAIEGLWIEIKSLWLKGILYVNQTWGTLEEGFDYVVTELKKTWNTFVEFMQEGVKKILYALGDLLGWISRNYGKIGALVTVGALIAGKGTVEAAAMGALAATSSNVLGSAGQDAVVMGLAGMAGNTVNAERENKKLDEAREGRSASREDSALVDEINMYGELADLEKRRLELIEQGNLAGAERLENEKALLEEKLKQAQAEADLSEAERARNAELKRANDELAEIEKRRSMIARDRDAIEEKWDPVKRYMRQLKELNSIYSEAERNSKAYRKELQSIQEQMAAAKMIADAQFGNMGMDAVRKGSQAEQQLIQNSLETMMFEKAREQGVEEAERLDMEAKDLASVTGEEKAVDALKEFFEGPMTDRLERIAIATEKNADKETIDLDPLGIL